MPCSELEQRDAVRGEGIRLRHIRRGRCYLDIVRMRGRVARREVVRAERAYARLAFRRGAKNPQVNSRLYRILGISVDDEQQRAGRQSEIKPEKQLVVEDARNEPALVLPAASAYRALE